MTLDQIDQLIEAMHANGVTRLEWSRKRKGTTLRLALSGDSCRARPPGPAPAESAPAIAVVSPGIGRFMGRGADDGLPRLAKGDAVRAGETLGYIAQGDGVLQLVVAPANGWLSGVLPTGDRVFGFGDAVLELEGGKE